MNGSMNPRLGFVLALLLAAQTAHPAHAAELYAPGAGSDPRLRSAHYQSGVQHQFSALAELLAMNPGGDPATMPEDYQWLLAQAYLNFGMASKALEVYRGLSTTDPLLLARSRLRLAQFEYQRGYLDDARATLETMRDKLPGDLLVEWQDLLARVLLAQGKFGETVKLLIEPKNGDDQSQYTRYNLAVAMINDGQLQKGRDVLDRVGRLRPVDTETLALRDRANLTLGWHYLKAELAGTAKGLFYRIRTVGPFSNRALLGLGWAELAPRGSAAARDIPEDLTPFSTFATLGGLLRPGFFDKDKLKGGPGAFKLEHIDPAEAEALRRALVPWVELISRDPVDPAVQEAWLAIPYSLDRLGAHNEALAYYEKAVTHLEENRQRLNAALASIKRGVMLETLVRRDMGAESGWQWKLRDLPDVPETYYLQTLLAEHRFQEAVKNYRDVRLLARTMDGWKQRLAVMEVAHAARGNGDDSVDLLIRRAKENWQAPWQHVAIQLRAEPALQSPGASDAPLESPDSTRGNYPVTLQLAGPPPRFNGASERIGELRTRIANLRELIATAGGEQSRLIQTMANAELQGQKQVVEKYLIEARFALARLYDREQRKAVAPEPPPEPRSGLLQRFLNVFGLGKRETKK